MKGQFESFRQQNLQHLHQAFVADGLVGSGSDLKPFGVDPIRTTQNPVSPDAIRAHNAPL
jgi:hypothetical protein